jgi:hypothetical protein
MHDYLIVFLHETFHPSALLLNLSKKKAEDHLGQGELRPYILSRALTSGSGQTLEPFNAAAQPTLFQRPPAATFPN